MPSHPPQFQYLVLLLALAVTAALADNPRPSYNSYDYPDSEPVYQYGYNVAAVGGYGDYQGASFAQDENRNGYETHGEYRVDLPDGRTQIVTYQVNGDSGFIADVRYEGEATYGAPAPAAYKPAPKPVYKPAPKPVVYKPAPKPVYKPAPAPVVYKPAPAPVVYKPVPKPAPKPQREYGPVRFNPFG